MENWREKLLELELLHCNHSNKDCTREDKGNFLAFKLRGKAQLCRRHPRQAFEHRTQDVSPSSAAHIFKQKISAASAFIKQGALFPVLTASDSLIYFFFFPLDVEFPLLPELDAVSQRRAQRLDSPGL